MNKTETAKSTQSNAASRYEKFKSERQSYIDRAKLVCAVTIPSISPVELKTGAKELHYTSQGLGAHGTNNLASKLMLALLPLNTPFVRFYPSEDVQREIEEAEANTGEAIQSTIDKALAKQESKVREDVEISGDRVKFFAALKYILTGGNALIDTAYNQMRIFNLSSYVVKRDPRGHVLETITHERVAPAVIEEKDPELYEALLKDPDFLNAAKKDDGEIDIYTHNQRKGNKWEVYQEVCGKKVPSSHGSYPLESPRFIVLAPIRVDGEDYGRAYIEEFVGDLITLEFLTRSIKEGAEAAAKFLIFVNPNGVTVPEDLENGENGDVLIGDSNDVSSFQLDKYADFRVARETIESIERRLERSFLLNASARRDAERVTAEEIRFMATELEDVLGGFYSVMAEEFQRPYAHRKLAQLRRNGTLKNLPKNAIKLSVVTGIEALGRGHDRTRLVGFIKTLYDTMGGEAFKRLNQDELIKRLATADGIDTEGLFMTEDQIKAEEQAMQQQQMAQQVTPEVIKQGGQVLQKQMDQQNQQPPQGE